MKRNRYFAAAVLTTAAVCALSSCKSKDNSEATADDTIQMEEMVSDVIESDSNPYDSAFFNVESNYQTTPSGLRYVVVSEGTGATPDATAQVTVNYEGRLLDGQIFDSSYARGVPATFPLNGVIKGWTEGLQLMKEGGTTIFYIPSELAYGAVGTPGGPIPPNSDLIFKVELIKVN